MIAIDKSLVKKQFNSGLKSYTREAGIQKQMAKKLIKKLCLLNKQPLSRIFEVGSGTGFLTQNIIEELEFEHLIVNDIATTSKQKIRELESSYGINIPFLEGDAEEIVIPHQLDAVISGSTIQWFKDIAGFINKVYHGLNPDGILAFSTFGCHNFEEIKSITGIGLDYLNMSDLYHILSGKFNILFSEEWVEKKIFDSPIDVLRHMKMTGVNGISKKPFGKKQLNNFTQSYKALYSDYLQRVTLTYNPIIIIVQKKQ